MRPGDGFCSTAVGTCTLRAAIQEANARVGADVIRVRAGTYLITRAEPAGGGISGGDVEITGAVTITGAGAARTVIDGKQRPHRAVVVAGGAGARVQLSA